MVERSERVKVLLLDGPFDGQDIYVEQTAIVNKAVMVMGERYELFEGCKTCSEAYCFRWHGHQAM